MVVAVLRLLVLVVAFALRGHQSQGCLVRILEFQWAMMAFGVLDSQIWKVIDVAKPIKVSLGVHFRRH